MNERHLKIPLTEDDVLGLRLGNIVYLSGKAFLSGMVFHRRVVEMGMMPRVDLDECNVLWLSGIVVKNQAGTWKVRSAGATTSIRYEKWMPALIERFGLRAVIGKGALGANTLAAMRQFRCVHLGKLGMTTGALYARAIKKVVDVEWLELGEAEALWTLLVEDLGPFVVDMDCCGGMLADTIYEEIDNKGIPEAYRMLGLEPPGQKAAGN